MLATTRSRFGGAFAMTVVVLAMFAPMVVIHLYGAEQVARELAAGGEITVGIAAILRASARRLLRGASSNLMKTTAGALGRTAARAMTRRFIKFTGRLFFSSIVLEASGDEDAEQRSASLRAQLFSLGLGFVALCLSFRGVLWVVDEGVAAEVLGTAGIGMLEVALLAGVPLFAYAAFQQVFGRLFAVRALYRTELDGLLLQAYFTGAGSFLPLTTDVEYTGTDEGKFRTALCSILGMFLAHIVLGAIGRAVDSSSIEFLGSMFLVYCFVYVFPIRPLEGHFIWARNKWIWALVTLPILAAFLSWLPPAIGNIL